MYGVSGAKGLWDTGGGLRGPHPVGIRFVGRGGMYGVIGVSGDRDFVAAAGGGEERGDGSVVCSVGVRNKRPRCTQPPPTHKHIT